MNAIRSLEPLDLSRTRVLIVEDNALDATLAERAMKRHGLHDCLRATSAEDGLDQLTKRDFEVVIVDDNLPRTSGAEFLAAARQIRPDIKYIVVTASRDDNIVAAALAAGAAECVSKEDFVSSGLIEAVHGTLLADEDRVHLAAAANIWGASAAPIQARQELDWLRTDESRDAPPPLTPVWDLDDNAVSICSDYFSTLIRNYPDRAEEEEDAVVQVLIDHGASPRDMLLLLDRAFMQVLLEMGREGQTSIPLRPSLPIARVLAGVVQAYQDMLAFQSLDQMRRSA